MKKKTFIYGATAILFIAVSCSNNTKTENHKNSANESKTELELDSASMVKRGAYLVTIGGCNDCHSPKIMTDHGPEPDPARLLSGHNEAEPTPDFDKNILQKGIVQANMNLTSWKGPWGISFAANITPDATGIGSWTLEQFTKALREGKYKGMDGSRNLLPPMPWFNYKYLTDEDMKSLFMYLKSIPPVKNMVPTPFPPQS